MPTQPSALDAGVARLAQAHDEALALALPDAVADYDPRWIETECDHWIRKPAKIVSVTRLGDLHLAVWWDQYFSLRVYPRPLFATLATVLAYHRPDVRHRRAPELASLEWERLFGRRPADLAASLAAQRERWAAFVEAHRPSEIDGAHYVDLGALLHNTACHWSGHWTFDGVVLDRYAGDRIDFAHYIAQRFNTGDAYERFARFAEEHERAGFTRENTWSLFTPSGERTLRLAAVVTMDGNSDSMLLEGPDEFIEVRASGS